MGLFDKFQGLAAARRGSGHSASTRSASRSSGSSRRPGVVRGRRTILAGTNNYLGLAFDPDCIAAAQAALAAEGTGTTGSRMANGSYANHRRLEAELAAFYGMRDAIVFSTGYQANLGMLSATRGPERRGACSTRIATRASTTAAASPARKSSGFATTTPTTSRSACAGSARAPRTR